MEPNPFSPQVRKRPYMPRGTKQRVAHAILQNHETIRLAIHREMGYPLEDAERHAGEFAVLVLLDGEVVVGRKAKMPALVEALSPQLPPSNPWVVVAHGKEKDGKVSAGAVPYELLSLENHEEVYSALCDWLTWGP